MHTGRPIGTTAINYLALRKSSTQYPILRYYNISAKQIAPADVRGGSARREKDFEDHPS